MSSPAQRHRLNAPDVTFESFESEVLVINLRSGSYYSLRGSAPAIWLQALRGLGSAEIARELAASCRIAESQVAPAVTRLIEELTAENLLVPCEGEPAPPGAEQPAAPLPGEFSEPVFERYTDMQQLLLMDPIHDVDPAGWPKAPVKKEP
jgi:hypothetical protein